MVVNFPMWEVWDLCGSISPTFSSYVLFHISIKSTFFNRFQISKVDCSENVGVWEHFRTFPYRRKNISSHLTFLFLIYTCILRSHTPTLPHPNFSRCVLRGLLTNKTVFGTELSVFVWEICGRYPHKCGTKVGAYPLRRGLRLHPAGAKRTAAWCHRCAWSWCSPYPCRA